MTAAVDPAASPASIYRRCADFHRTEEARRRRQLDWIGWGRVAVVVWGAMQFGVSLVSGQLSLGWLLAPIAALAALSWVFTRTRFQRDVARRAAEFHEFGIARIEERWQGRGERGERHLAEDHLYAADLDLFGAGSLFERICEARTRIGQDTLAGWMLAPAASNAIVRRQAAVRELRPNLALRERMAILGARLPAGIDTPALQHWASEPSTLPQWGRAAIPLWTLATAVGLLLIGLDWLPWWTLGLPLFGQVAFVMALAPRTRPILEKIERRAGELLELTEILAALESEPVQAPLLREFQHALLAGNEPPSRQLRRLVTLVDLLNARRNQFFIPIALLLMWGTRMAYAMERWRENCGSAVRRWFTVLGEMEALLSLAGYSFENPDDSFPEVVADRVCFEAAELGHPLLPRARCVRNDVALGEVRLWIVSGSNMSGKSTLLRAIGINAALAQAGGPVCASSLRLSPLAIGATLRIQDSLQAGKSRFYAEITRIERIVSAAAGPIRLLFLLDELLHGTNSHDRRTGAAAILRTLVDRGAIGLITTHDLALADLAAGFGPLAENVHFADHMIEGRLVFDYRARAGIVQHSNAVALMRAVGLPVDEPHGESR